jgi:hypothetical protein
MRDRVPNLVTDVTAEWVGGLLDEYRPGTRVDDVQVLERHEVTNCNGRLRVRYGANPHRCPDTFFLKLPPSDPARRRQVAQTTMGEREARFYDQLAPKLDLRTPTAYGTAFEPDTGDFALLLEDLTSSGATVSDGPTGIPVDGAAVALEQLAAMHARFQPEAVRAAEAPWVTASPLGGDYGSDMLRIGIRDHRDRLGAKFCEVAELYINRRRELHDLWHEGAPTVIHGDTHIGNLFIDANGVTVGFLDWGITNLNTPIREVGYFLTMSLTIDDRRAHDVDLWRHYLDAARACGFEGLPGFDEVWRWYRIHAAYCVPAASPIVTFPESRSRRRTIFGDAFVARAIAAVEDLEAAQALRDAGI